MSSQKIEVMVVDGTVIEVVKIFAVLVHEPVRSEYRDVSGCSGEIM